MSQQPLGDLSVKQLRHDTAERLRELAEECAGLEKNIAELTHKVVGLESSLLRVLELFYAHQLEHEVQKEKEEQHGLVSNQPQ